MNRISVVILWVLALLALQPALAAEPRQQPTAREKARTVYIFHQPVVMLQATFGQTTPEERVLRTRSALRAFTEDDIRQPLRIVPVIRYGQPGRLFLMNGKPVLLLSQADLDEGDDLSLDQAAQRVLARMEAQRTGLQEQFNQRYLLISAGKALAPGRCCWRCFTTALSAPGGGYGAFSSCGSSKSAALFLSTGGAFSAISRSDCMPRWRSSSVSWPVTSG